MKKEEKGDFELLAEEFEEEPDEEELRSYAIDADDTYEEEVKFKEEKALRRDEGEEDRAANAARPTINHLTDPTQSG